MGNPIQHYDAVVIGAGNGGHCCHPSCNAAAEDIAAGAAHIPGGCATSFRGDYEFEVALHQLSGLGTDTQPFIMRQLFSDLGVRTRWNSCRNYRVVSAGGSRPARYHLAGKLERHDAHAAGRLSGRKREAIERSSTWRLKLTMENFLQLPHCPPQITIRPCCGPVARRIWPMVCVRRRRCWTSFCRSQTDLDHRHLLVLSRRAAASCRLPT